MQPGAEMMLCEPGFSHDSFSFSQKCNFALYLRRSHICFPFFPAKHVTTPF